MHSDVFLFRLAVSTLSIACPYLFLFHGSAVAQKPVVPPPSPVSVASVSQQVVASGESFVGTIHPYKKVVIGPAVDGRVTEVLVDEGDHVRNGQPLVKLLTSTIELEHQAAAAELEFRRQQLAELEAGSRPEEIAQAESLMRGSEAKRNYLDLRRRRLEKLFEAKSATSAEDRDEAVAAALQAEQDFISAKLAYELAVTGPRKEKLLQAQAQVEMQQAVVSRLADQIEKHTIYARFDGYVTDKQTEVGAWATKGAPLIDVVALDPVEVEAYVLEQHVAFVRIGEEVRVEVPAVADRVFLGEVVQIIPEADPRARTFPVKIRIANPPQDHGPTLKGGMSARVTLPTGPEQEALLVSKDAIVLGPKGAILFCVDPAPDGTEISIVRPVPVELGIAQGGMIQVQGALTKNDRVVVRGNERLRPGQQVRVTEVVQDLGPTPKPATSSP